MNQLFKTEYKLPEKKIIIKKSDEGGWPFDSMAQVLFSFLKMNFIQKPFTLCNRIVRKLFEQIFFVII